MDLKHIRSFAAVAREGNLTRAAEHHLTQPARSACSSRASRNRWT